MTLIKIKCCDFLDGMRELGDNSIDAIITDPPYMTTDLHFDKQGFNLDDFLSESLRVIKPNGYFAVFAPFEMQGIIAQTFSLRFTGIWLKTLPTMRTSTAKKPMSKQEGYGVYAHPEHKIKELIWNPIKIWGHKPYKKLQHNRGYVRNDALLTNRATSSVDRASPSAYTKDGYVCDNPGFRYQTDVIEGNNKSAMEHSERTLHPTQKPLKVMSTLIQWLTNEADIVLDPFMGSGTTGVAAQRLNRGFVGFEIDSEYFEIGSNRVVNAMDNFQEKIEL